MIEHLFLIALICTYCIGYSGFIDELDGWLQRYMKNPLVHCPKPFSCELCCTWWGSLLYIAITGNFTLFGIAMCCIASYSTKLIGPLLHLIADFWNKMIDALYNQFGL